MCIISATVGTAALTIATALATSAMGIQSAVSRNKSAEFQIEQSERQAKIAERNAIYERQAGIDEARHQRLKSIQNMQNIRTRIAAGNVATSSETALNLFDDEKLSGEADALKLIDTSEKRAETQMNNAQNLYLNAKLTKYNAKRNLLNTELGSALALGSKFIG